MNANLLSAAQALGGGVLIGLASWLLLASMGRVAGISGILSAALPTFRAQQNTLQDSAENANVSESNLWRWTFLVGLIFGGAVFAAWFQPAVLSTRPLLVLIAAGLLVGIGTVVGAGCTSGHGVCGLGRRSLRSLVATLTFMVFGFATVAVIYLFVGRAMI